jgi:replicative DNA helicase
VKEDDNLWEGTEFDHAPANKTRKPKAQNWIPDRLPEDIDAEAGFIATAGASYSGKPEIEACLTLAPDDFVHPIHRNLFIAIRNLQSKGSEINSLTIKDESEKMGVLDKVGGFTGIVEVLAHEDVANPMVLADIIREKSKLRKLIHVGAKIVTDASGLGDYHEIISGASEAITRLATDHPGSQIISDMSDLLDDLADGRQITTQNGGRAMSWGDDTLDRICPIPQGEPTIIAARPGVGKSAMAIQVLVATIERGLGTPLFLSLEMGRDKVKARLAAHLSEVNSRVFRDGQYDGGMIERIIDRKRVLSGMKTMFPKQQCRVEEIEALVQHAVDVHGITCVVLDQFSHVAAPKESLKENYAIANAQISKHLTALAKNLNLGWVTLAQINKDGEDSRRPTMKDLAATDRLAQDAAVIFGMWNKGTDENQEVWGTVMKNRDDGFKGWHKPLAADLGTCSFRVTEQETQTRTTRF